MCSILSYVLWVTMFQYVIVWWYVLTIILIASIVGYIAYYVLQWFSLRKLKYRSINSSNDADESSQENQLLVGEENEGASLWSDKEVVLLLDEKITTEVWSDGQVDVIATLLEEAVEFWPWVWDNQEEDEDSSIVKKHKVKNIAEWVSRDDILQDKHEKNLQKVKYEALLCKQRNDLAWYEKKLIEWLILDPDDIDIYRQLADFYFSEGKYTKALSMFRKILLFDPEDHHALWQIGEIYIEQWQYEDAQVFVEKALSLSPDNPKYYISLIDITIAKEEFDQALIYLEKIVGLRPRNISYIMALGEMYEKLWRKEDAKTTYFRVLEIDPLHIDVKHILKRF